MISLREALDIVKRALKVVVGLSEPMPREDASLQSLGISSNQHLEMLKKSIKVELASEGYEFTKMSLDGLQLSHTVKEAADLVRHARSESEPRFY